MRRSVELMLAAALAALVGCDAAGSQRGPLSIVEQHPAGSGQIPVGAAGAGGDTSATGGQPPSSSPPPQPGTAGTGGDTGATGGDTGATGGQPPSSSPPVQPAPACWTPTLPPEPQPVPPKLSMDESCRDGSSTTSWSFPMAPTDTLGDKDARGNIVGRWVSCGQPMFDLGPHDGLEFGGNGRWQLLSRDASGALVPTTPPVSGSFNLLSSGQLDLIPDGRSATGGRAVFVRFAGGFRDILGIDAKDPFPPAFVYARTAATPSNGDDDRPPLSDGHCSMVGDWDVPANASPAAPASTWSFDGLGNFVVGPPGAATCDAHARYGSYSLSAEDGFQIVTNWNLGPCSWFLGAGYSATFDAQCAKVTLMNRWDGCMGSRGYLDGTTTLTRRQ